MATVDMFDKLNELFYKYDKLPLILCSGVVTLRVARNILHITQEEMIDLYAALIECEAVRGVSSSTFRAVQDAEDYAGKYERDMVGLDEDS